MHWPRNALGWLALAHDAVMAALTFWLAHYLRLDDRIISFSGHYLWQGTLAFVIINTLACVGFGLYRGLWRYASMQDVVTITKAVSLSLLIFYIGLFAAMRLEGVPRSVPFIHWLLMLAMLGGPRFAYRMLKDKRLGVDFTLAAPKVPVLIVGANRAAEMFIRESQRNPSAPYRVVGLTDDDDRRRGQQLHGVRIYGTTEMLARIVGKLGRKGRKPQRIVLAEYHPDGRKIEALLSVCDQLGLPLSRLPESTELKAGAETHAEIKPIAVEDLLRRPQHVHDRDGMRRLIEGKAVLVTGEGGTIGGELTRQIAGFKPSKLILFDHSEYALYLIERELVDGGCTIPLHAVLGDVRDAAHVEYEFKTHQPQLVFHAAALKHVPLAEENPIETMLTNVEGTRLVAEATARHGAQAMVLISTDKAVHPGNVMGATKRLAEKLLQAKGQESNAAAGGTQFFTVRFGNVLGSTGSVVPRFQQQLASGGPLTVTHPEMTRYFMTVREAVELVIQAAALGLATQGSNGSLYVLDMGTPVKIDDLARQMIRLAGLSPEQVKITYTGLRAGEKMHEALFYEQEVLEHTAHGAIRRVKSEQGSVPRLDSELKPLLAACQARDKGAALAALKALVPEYDQGEL